MCPEQYCGGGEQVEYARSNQQGSIRAFTSIMKACSVRLAFQDLCVLRLQCLLSTLQLSPLKVQFSGLPHQHFLLCCYSSGVVCLTLSQSMFSFLQGLLLLFIFCSTTEGVLSVATYCKMVQFMCNTLCILHMTAGITWPRFAM